MCSAPVSKATTPIPLTAAAQTLPTEEEQAEVEVGEADLIEKKAMRAKPTSTLHFSKTLGPTWPESQVFLDPLDNLLAASFFSEHVDLAFCVAIHFLRL